MDFFLHRPPYSPDLAPSDFLLFDPLKNALSRRRFTGDGELEHSYVESSDASVESLTLPAYSVSRKGGKSLLIMKETLWKNSLNFVKDVLMVYVNLSTIVVIVSEKE